MAFNANDKIKPANVGSGEIWHDGFITHTSKFDANIKTGKFASLVAGVLTTGTGGTLAGVVVRKITGSLEVAEEDDVHERVTEVEFMRAGGISVDVKTGDSPAFGGKVYVDTDGRATTDNSKPLSNAEFIREIAGDVWLIRLI
jgi:hypothetical protein